jgi:two-component system, cell cycle sensor histidine kinase and response regulator CckA
MTRGPIDPMKGRQTGARPQAQTRILVVEDSATQAEALRALLEGAGYTVALASSGEDGLARLDAQEFDVVISDIVMPGTVDGYELCRRIKAGTRRATPVVLLTSLSDPLDIIRGLECGADNFFTKGVDPAHLLDRLQLLRTTRETRSQSKLRMGVSVFFMGHDFTITSEREQILDLLISTFEDAVLQNRALRQREDELEIAKAALARRAGTLEERLQQVLNSVPDMLFSLDATITQLYYVSPASADILGLSPEELGADASLILRAIHPDDQPAVMAGGQEAIRNGRSGTMECRVRHADGAIRWIRITLVPVAEHGTVVRLDGIARDITEWKHLEEQLHQAQKMEAVGRLAGGVAHDFNNLLTAILGSAELVLESLKANAAEREEVEEIRKAAVRAADLTRQLLAFSRQQVISPAVLNPNEVVANMDKLLRRLLGEDVELRATLARDLGTVKADPSQMEQVIVNLAVNARDAMPNGGQLTIETHNVELDEAYVRGHISAQPGRYVMFSVSDTGIGMDAATQARIFEPFFTTKEKGKGTGLGLATVYGIVKQSGGWIWVYSEVGHGTSFKVYLPRVTEAAAPAAQNSTPPISVRGSQTILLVEDEELVRHLVQKVLKANGYTVLVAASGADAERVAGEHEGSIHLLMTDVVLPGINGRQVAERLTVERPGIKVLYLSGYTDDAIVRHGVLEAGVAFLQKPFTPMVLARKVREVLDSPAE